MGMARSESPCYPLSAAQLRLLRVGPAHGRARLQSGIIPGPVPIRVPDWPESRGLSDFPSPSPPICQNLKVQRGDSDQLKCGMSSATGDCGSPRLRLSGWQIGDGYASGNDPRDSVRSWMGPHHRPPMMGIGDFRALTARLLGLDSDLTGRLDTGILSG